jgi:enoyl-CoA hydratase
VPLPGADYIRRFLPMLHRMYEAVFFHPKPLVAAINGHAIAGGCVLACCADRRIMARSGGRMGITELLVGVPFPALAFEIVRFAVPGRNLPEFTYAGATYDVDASLARGWVDVACRRARNGAVITEGVHAGQEATPPRSV